MVVSADKLEILTTLETEVEKLLRHCTYLQEEVALLRSRELLWSQERVRLLERHATVRIRLAAMVSRLKFLERL